MTILVTMDEVKATVSRLLADPEYGPDHTARCDYGELDEPICIVGHLMAEFHPEFFPMIEQHKVEGVRIDCIPNIEYDSTRTKRIVSNIQDIQDEGFAWGMAVEESGLEVTA